MQNITQQELADRLKVSRQYIWRIENGKINISLNYLDELITKLKCTHNDFFNAK